MARVIWCPAGIYAREPCVTVIWSWAPISVFIEILESHDTAIAVARRGRILIAPLAAIGPFVKIIGTPDLDQLLRSACSVPLKVKR